MIHHFLTEVTSVCVIFTVMLLDYRSRTSTHHHFVARLCGEIDI